MKKIFIILILCVLAVSNLVSRTPENPVAVYYFQFYVTGITYKAYLILKGSSDTKRKTYEEYQQNDSGNSVGYSIFGEWKISNDTLYLTPKYETVSYGEKAGNIQSIHDKGYLDVGTIPQQFLIKEDSIIDITDYDSLFGTGQTNITLYEFKRLWGGNLWDYVAK